MQLPLLAIRFFFFFMYSFSVLLVPEVSFSIGIATRFGSESFADLARRASSAMREVKLAGGGYWRVSLILH